MKFDGTITWDLIGSVIFVLLTIVGSYFSLKTKINLTASATDELDNSVDEINSSLQTLKEDLIEKYNLNKTLIHNEIKTELLNLTTKIETLETNFKKSLNILKQEINETIKDKVAVYEDKYNKFDISVNEKILSTKEEINNKIDKMDKSIDKEIEMLKKTIFKRIDENAADLKLTIKDLNTLNIKLEQYNIKNSVTIENIKHLSKLLDKNEENIKFLLDSLTKNIISKGS